MRKIIFIMLFMAFIPKVLYAQQNCFTESEHLAIQEARKIIVNEIDRSIGDVYEISTYDNDWKINFSSTHARVFPFVTIYLNKDNSSKYMIICTECIRGLIYSENYHNQ